MHSGEQRAACACRTHVRARKSTSAALALVRRTQVLVIQFTAVIYAHIKAAQQPANIHAFAIRWLKVQLSVFDGYARCIKIN